MCDWFDVSVMGTPMGVDPPEEDDMLSTEINSL